MAYTDVEVRNVAVVRRLFEEGFNRCDTAVLDEVLADDFVLTASGAVAGDDAAKNGTRETLKAGMLHNHACFANWRFELFAVLADDDHVAVRWRGTGLHRGSFLRETPTGKTVLLEGNSMFRLANGRIAQDWVFANKLDFLTSLGIMRPPSMPGAADSEALVRAFWSDVINAHDPEAADRLMAADYRQHTPGIDQGPAGFKAFFRAVLTESKGMRAEMTDALSVDDLIICRTTIRFDEPPPGWANAQSIVDIFRVAGGRLAEHWDLR